MMKGERREETDELNARLQMLQWRGAAEVRLGEENKLKRR